MRGNRGLSPIIFLPIIFYYFITPRIVPVWGLIWHLEITKQRKVQYDSHVVGRLWHVSVSSITVSKPIVQEVGC